MSRTITAEHVPALARGAAVLGAGGGGDPHIGALLATQALRRYGNVNVVSLDEVPDDALIVLVAMMGAPTVVLEKLPGLEEIVAPMRALSSYLGRPVTHIGCFEAGGINSTIPIAAAAALGLPLIDADGQGRAFPELQMVLPTLYGIPAAPFAFSDEKGNVGVLSTVDNSWTERIARVACVEMGCSVMFTGFPMSGLQAREALVRDTLTLCRDIGEGMSAARAQKTDPVARTVDRLGGREIFAGKVVDVNRATTAGFARGSARVEHGTSGLNLSFQNELLIAEMDGRTLTTTPDLIIVLEHDTGEPITTDGLRFGQRVRVVTAPSDERWHSQDGLTMVGPGYFGYESPSYRFDGSLDATGSAAQ